MRLLLAFSLVLLCTSTVSAEEPHGPPEFAALAYRNIGPYAGGRVSKVCGVSGDPLTYYAATASGGIWKSVDGGVKWKPMFDDQVTSSIGCLAVAASDANVVYVGTGEANIRGNVSPGAGIFKSTDAGKTWEHIWKQHGQIGAIVVDPKNADVCYAAVLGRAFGPNAERGIFRTTDGGKNWKKVCFVNDDTGASDVALDPNNSRIVFAGFWQTRRKPWELTSGGPGSDLFVSRDGGDSWTSLKTPKKKNDPEFKNGLPSGIWGKVGVAVAPSDSKRIYALIEAEKGGLFRSDDGGETWSLASDDRLLRQRAWYYSTLTIHPNSADVLYAPQVPLLKSIDGGKSVKAVKGPHHGDHHDLWIDPKNPDRMINANDGGVDISTDGGKTWFAPPLPITQFYHVHADNSVPYRVMGCMQDLGSASGPSDSLKGNIGLGDWHTIGGGEAGHAVTDPKDPLVVYAGEYGGIMTRYDHRTKQARNITVNQWNPSGIEPAKHKYRFQWTAPILVSQHDGAVYHAGNVLFKTTDHGGTWTPISPDLTRNDKQKQQWSGGPITGDNTGAETYCTIFALSESPKKAAQLWAGTDDGKVHVTLDGGKSWKDLTANIPDFPDWGMVTCIEPSPFDAATAYLVVDNHRMDDNRPHVWKTTDTGKSWTRITDGLDGTTHCKVVREDPNKKGLLYLGTERGIQYSPNAGKTWKSLQLNLPTVPVHDLQVKNNDLVVGTHGRSFWILDDLTVVRNFAENLKAKPFHLYPAQPCNKWNTGGGGDITNHHVGRSAPNPDRGVAIWYQLSEKPKSELLLEIRNSDGKLVATGKGKPKKDDDKEDEDDDDEDGGKKERKLPVKAGLNKFVWDLTHDGADTIPGAKVDAGNPGQGIPAAPGKYTIQLTLGKDSQSTTVEVKPDVRIKFSADAAREQETLALKVRDDIASLTDAVLRLRALNQQIKLRKELFKDNKAAEKQAKAEEAFGKKLDELEEKLHNPKAKVVYDVFAAKPGAMLYSQFTWLLNNVTDGDGAPTKPQSELQTELTKRLAGHLVEFGKLTTTELQKLNEAADRAELPKLFLSLAKAKDEEGKE